MQCRRVECGNGSWMWVFDQYGNCQVLRRRYLSWWPETVFLDQHCQSVTSREGGMHSGLIGGHSPAGLPQFAIQSMDGFRVGVGAGGAKGRRCARPKMGWPCLRDGICWTLRAKGPGCEGMKALSQTWHFAQASLLSEPRETARVQFPCGYMCVVPNFGVVILLLSLEPLVD